MIDVALRSLSVTRAHARELAARPFWIAIGAITAAVAGVLAFFIHAWPPHEDETLALFVGRQSLPQVLHTVIAERGGAPLHFLFAWAIVHLDGGLTALRVLSLIFAVASIPAIAVLASRLADRTVAVVAVLLAGGTWVFLFHGIYGRMYSLFLFTSALSFIALLDAVELGGRKRFAFWGLALVATVASHPYGVFVVVAQAVYVGLRRKRLRGALVTLAIVAAVGTPFWFADTVLGHRYDLGLGGGGPRLGSPGSVLHYLWLVAGDFSAGTHRWLTPVLVLAAIGFIALLRARRTSALLALCVIVVPAVALMLAKLSSNASPESRHLIFALPFFSTLIASGLVAIGRMRAPLAPLLAVVGIAMLVVGEVRWADAKTPALFHGDPPARAAARNAAASWLASTSRPNDVLFGYEPLYLAAWERDRSFSKHALPRADPKLLANKLRRLPAPLGRGVWVLDADDSTDVTRSLTIPLLLPQPEASFEARTFGPYLVIRSRAPLQTPERYLAAAKSVERLGTTLKIGDASINLYALALAQQQLYGSSSRSRSSSRSTISR